MFKKLFIAGAVMAASTTVAFASAPYIGISAGEKTNTATNVNYRGLPANFFVGYGADLGQNVYLAGEVFLSAASATIKDDGLKSTYGYGASILPGIMIGDHTMGFLRLGLVRTCFTPAGGSDETLSGMQLGLGMQASLMQSWDLRGEYIFSDYSSLNGVAGDPRTDEFDLGLVYKFD